MFQVCRRTQLNDRPTFQVLIILKKEAVTMSPQKGVSLKTIKPDVHGLKILMYIYTLQILGHADST